uniref:Uncharacterized protein n=1 Tax=Rhizophora mucronata TaxID=61149 RepID=A0A2P2KHC2_RHIMU
MNQLQSELRLARSVIAERDSEVQKVRATNNQYVEENERLRAILGEWSNRAAKVLSFPFQHPSLTDVLSLFYTLPLECFSDDMNS